jgi:hypothetical protein
MVYFAYFHSVIIYGIIFWGNSTDADRVFMLQKRIVRIVAGVGSRSSCRSLFMKLYILPVPCQYIFSLMMFFVDNQENFQTNYLAWIQEMRLSFTGLLPISHAFRKVFSVLV